MLAFVFYQTLRFLSIILSLHNSLTLRFRSYYYDLLLEQEGLRTHLLLSRGSYLQ